VYKDRRWLVGEITDRLSACAYSSFHGQSGNFSESISDDCIAAYLRLGTLRLVQRSHAGQIQTFGRHFWSKQSGQYNLLNGWNICVGDEARPEVQTDDAWRAEALFALFALFAPG
jgi:hypothetical protein